MTLHVEHDVGQAVQLPEPANAYVPEPHAVHFVLPAAAYVPAEHVVHVDAPDVVDIEPAGQLAHAAVPPATAYLPAVH